MGLDLDRLREMIYAPLGIAIGDPQYPLDLCDLHLNRAFWEVQNKFPFREKEIVSSFQTQAGIRIYTTAFPTEAIKHVAIEDPISKQHFPLDKITVDTYETLYRDDQIEWGFPTKHVLEGCTIRFWRTPLDIYLIIFRRQIALSDLSSLVTAPDVPQEWHEVIGFGGLWRAYIHFNDFARSRAIKAIVTELIDTIVPREAKEEQTNSRYAGLQPLGISYDFDDPVIE